MPATRNRQQQQQPSPPGQQALGAGVGGVPLLDPAKACRAAIDQGQLQECHFEQALRTLSPALAMDAYSLAGHTPAGFGGRLSPTWSASSTSNNGDSAPPGPCSATHSPLTLFPSLAPGALDVDASAFAGAFIPGATAGAPNDAAAHGPGAPAAADAALDGWLQQFVNADAIDSAASKRSWAADPPLDAEPMARGAADALYPCSLATPMPGLLHTGTPADDGLSRSPLGAYMDLLDETTVAAIASAVSSTLPADMLASVFSSASGFCPPATVAAPSASEMGMLAALPFVSITPAANIAPQKTLSAAVPATPELGPLEPAAAAGHMVPLAPRSPPACADAAQREQPPASEGKQTKKASHAGKSASPDPSQSTSSSGTSTPPGLSVLAKIAQRQVPISVKAEDPLSAAGRGAQQLRPLAQAHSPNARALQKQSQAATPQRASATPQPPPPQQQQQHGAAASPADSTTQKRQERLIKNRAAALLSRKRKREYMTKLESEVEELRETNSSLARRLEEMERRLNALTTERDMLRSANSTSAADSGAATGSSSANGTSCGDANGASAGNAEPEPESGSGSSQQQQQEQQSDSARPASDNAACLADAMETDAMECDAAPPVDADSEHTADEPRIQPRVTPPADAPKAKEQSGSQRSAGVLLMAMLFSFSLFTLPSLFAPESQIAAGGSQAIGLLPTGAPPAAEPRLLISARAAADDEHRLVERVRRTISALAQRPDDAQPRASHNDTAGSRMRPMTMAESASLHSWIKRGLAAAPGNALPAADAPPVDGSAQPRPRKPVAEAAAQTSSLSVVRQPHVAPRDYAMLYCPTMKHVRFGGDAGQLAAMDSADPAPAPVRAPPGTARVLGAAKAHGDASDVDDCTHDSDIGSTVAAGALSSPKLERRAADVSRDVADWAPTHAGARHAEHRPKLSFYSPIVAGDGPEVLSPWEEYARLSSSPSSMGDAGDARQKYLRIDVEVVGSKWVTADKFASGLY
ncbi:hypothetical protein IWQ56_000781 [Coemansia nantahalensis]|nr:hypothetical protein IWQ56_000781 [Coemansia nantahalensis]